MSATPNFTGWRAAILHPDDGHTERLVRQLKLFGIQATRQWSPLAPADLPDIVIVDADQGWDELMPWQGEDPPVPVIALLGSEAPGRIAWAMRQRAGAIIAKPVASSAVYPALVMAIAAHEERRRTAARIEALEARLRYRPMVFAAVSRIMEERGIGEDAAYAALREASMRQRLPMEQVAAFFLAGVEKLPEAG